MISLASTVIPAQAGIQHTRPFALDSGSALCSARNDRREGIIYNMATVLKSGEGCLLGTAW